jgi:hypothetical protein
MAERRLGEALAAELGGRNLGMMRRDAASHAVASAAGSGRVLACTVSAYVPYDPVRLVVRIELHEAGPRPMSTHEVLALGTSPSASPSERVSSAAGGAHVAIDFGSEEVLAAYAMSQEGGRRVDAVDLLEAEILLRDPARHFPFAARRIASVVQAPGF